MNDNIFAWVTYSLMGISLVVLLLIPFACTMQHKEHQRLQAEMQADQCKLQSEAKTGKRVYCGKACWRDEIRKEFSCNSGVKVIVN